MSYLETLTAVAVIVVPMISLQTFWIARGFSSLERQLGARIEALAARTDGVEDSLGQRIDGVENSLAGRLERVEDRLDRVDQRLDHIVQDHTQRITRLEEGS